MGRRKLTIASLFVTIFLFHITCFSQTNIVGLITGTTEKLSSVSIVLKDSISEAIIDYTFSDDKGTYSLTTSKKGKFLISFSSLGYKTKTISIEIDNQK